MLLKFFEFKETDLEPIKSFIIKDDLNPKIWKKLKINKDIRKDLLIVADDFFKSCELNTNIIDIILTGSLANYNWSEKYSDFDLHILIDFKFINKDSKLVKKLCDEIKKSWNDGHDIMIKGYEVEVYIQDIDEVHRSNGMYSLLNNKWLKIPKKIKFELNEHELEEKSKPLMLIIDEIEGRLDKDNYSSFSKKLEKVWKKIKRLRQSGLEKDGEYSLGNLVFKLLRRNGYLGKIMKLKKNSYDKQFEKYI